MERYFAEEHAAPASQLGHEPCLLADSPEVAALRGTEDYEGLLKLGKALCWQLRYREAVEVYTRAIELCPEDIRARQARASRYLTTLRPREAEADLLRCRAMGMEELEVLYRLGLCAYWAGDYRRAMEEMAACYPLCDQEMGIACIFWHTLSAWRAGEAPELLQKEYRQGMEVGHHTAYDRCMGLAAGYASLEDVQRIMAAEDSDLEYSILAYGVSGYLAHMGRQGEADELRHALLRRDGFWISYAYMAAWNDEHPQK